MKCKKCTGKGFIEYESGTIMVECAECQGKGEIEDVVVERDEKGIAITNISNKAIYLDKGEISDNELYRRGAEVLPPGTYTRTEVEEALNANISGTERDNQPTGSGDTSEPKRTRKPKTKKKAGKRTS